MSTKRQTTPVNLLPFQQENVSTSQQNIPVPYLAGERLIAVRWMTPALDERTQNVTGSGKKG